jgi:hypothetical protein
VFSRCFVNAFVTLSLLCFALIVTLSLLCFALIGFLLKRLVYSGSLAGVSIVGRTAIW